VPQDRDTHCPFTPIEIGGDGAYPFNGNFLHRVIDDKSVDPRETLYRLQSLMGSKFSHKYVRSDRLDKVVHKHHLYLPKLEGMRELLPPDSVIKPDGEPAKVMLRSMRFDDIETPEKTFFRLVRGLYYRELFRGREPPVPEFKIERSYSAGHTDEPCINLHDFIERWRNPGFKFQDMDDYFVDRKKVNIIDPLSLGWKFNKVEHYPSSRELFNDWARRNISFEETSLPDILEMLKTHKPLPDRVLKRLNLFIESDSYIMHVLDTRPRRIIGLVTRDLRLCKRVKDTIDAKNDERCIVIACDPLVYLVGRWYEVVGQRIIGWREMPEDIDWIEDPGAMLHVDFTEFTDGVPHREDIFDAPVCIGHTRWDGVYTIYLR
jgi:hypothetical protein